MSKSIISIKKFQNFKKNSKIEFEDFDHIYPPKSPHQIDERLDRMAKSEAKKFFKFLKNSKIFSTPKFLSTDRSKVVSGKKKNK